MNATNKETPPYKQISLRSINSETFSEVQGLAPKLSNADKAEFNMRFERGSVLRGFDEDVRSGFKRAVLAADSMAPSWELYCARKDIVERWGTWMRRLLLDKNEWIEEQTIDEILERLYTDDNRTDSHLYNIQTSENTWRTVKADVNDRRELSRRQLWLFVMRQDTKTPSENADIPRLAAMAERLGFISTSPTAWAYSNRIRSEAARYNGCLNMACERLVTAASVSSKKAPAGIGPLSEVSPGERVKSGGNSPERKNQIAHARKSLFFDIAELLPSERGCERLDWLMILACAYRAFAADPGKPSDYASVDGVGHTFACRYGETVPSPPQRASLASDEAPRDSQYTPELQSGSSADAQSPRTPNGEGAAHVLVEGRINRSISPKEPQLGVDIGEEGPNWREEQVRDGSATPNTEDCDRFYNMPGAFPSMTESEEPAAGNEMEFVAAPTVSPEAQATVERDSSFLEGQDITPCAAGGEERADSGTNHDYEGNATSNRTAAEEGSNGAGHVASQEDCLAKGEEEKKKKLGTPTCTRLPSTLEESHHTPSGPEDNESEDKRLGSTIDHIVDEARLFEAEPYGSSGEDNEDNQDNQTRPNTDDEPNIIDRSESSLTKTNSFPSPHSGRGGGRSHDNKAANAQKKSLRAKKEGAAKQTALQERKRKRNVYRTHIRVRASPSNASTSKQWNARGTRRKSQMQPTCESGSESDTESNRYSQKKTNKTDIWPPSFNQAQPNPANSFHAEQGRLNTAEPKMDKNISLPATEKPGISDLSPSTGIPASTHRPWTEQAVEKEQPPTEEPPREQPPTEEPPTEEPPTEEPPREQPPTEELPREQPPTGQPIGNTQTKRMPKAPAQKPQEQHQVRRANEQAEPSSASRTTENKLRLYLTKSQLGKRKRQKRTYTSPNKMLPGTRSTLDRPRLFRVLSPRRECGYLWCRCQLSDNTHQAASQENQTEYIQPHEDTEMDDAPDPLEPIPGQSSIVGEPSYPSSQKDICADARFGFPGKETVQSSGMERGNLHTTTINYPVEIPDSPVPPSVLELSCPVATREGFLPKMESKGHPLKPGATRLDPLANNIAKESEDHVPGPTLATSKSTEESNATSSMDGLSCSDTKVFPANRDGPTGHGIQPSSPYTEKRDPNKRVDVTKGETGISDMSDANHSRTQIDPRNDSTYMPVGPAKSRERGEQDGKAEAAGSQIKEKEHSETPQGSIDVNGDATACLHSGEGNKNPMSDADNQQIRSSGGVVEESLNPPQLASVAGPMLDGGGTGPKQPVARVEREAYARESAMSLHSGQAEDSISSDEVSKTVPEGKTPGHPPMERCGAETRKPWRKGSPIVENFGSQDATVKGLSQPIPPIMADMGTTSIPVGEGMSIQKSMNERETPSTCSPMMPIQSTPPRSVDVQITNRRKECVTGTQAPGTIHGDSDNVPIQASEVPTSQDLPDASASVDHLPAFQSLNSAERDAEATDINFQEAVLPDTERDRSPAPARKRARSSDELHSETLEIGIYARDNGRTRYMLVQRLHQGDKGQKYMGFGRRKLPPAHEIHGLERSSDRLEDSGGRSDTAVHPGHQDDEPMLDADTETGHSVQTSGQGNPELRELSKTPAPATMDHNRKAGIHPSHSLGDLQDEIERHFYNRAKQARSSHRNAFVPSKYILHLRGSKIIDVTEKGKISPTIWAISQKPGAGFFTVGLQHVSKSDILSAMERYSILVFQHGKEFSADTQTVRKTIKERIKRIEKTTKEREAKEHIFSKRLIRNHGKTAGHDYGTSYRVVKSLDKRRRGRNYRGFSRSSIRSDYEINDLERSSDRLEDSGGRSDTVVHPDHQNDEPMLDADTEAGHSVQTSGQGNPELQELGTTPVPAAVDHNSEASIHPSHSLGDLRSEIERHFYNRAKQARPSHRNAFVPSKYILHLRGSRIIDVTEKGKISPTIRAISRKPGAGFFTVELQHISRTDILSAMERYNILVFQHAEESPANTEAFRKTIEEKVKRIGRTMKAREEKQRMFPWKINRNYAKNNP